MSDELAHAVELPSFRVRVRHGVRHPANWLQLIRFGAVGASGYVVNLAVFAACVHLLKIDYRISSVLAFLVSVGNNFWLNRHWTFDARHDHPIHQGARFFTVSLLAFALHLRDPHRPGRRGGDEQGAWRRRSPWSPACRCPSSGQKLWSFRA